MTGRRQVLLALMLLAPGATPALAGRKAAPGRPAKRAAEHRPRRPVRNTSAKGLPGPRRPARETAGVPAGPERSPDDAPKLLPVDRDQARAWLDANAGWRAAILPPEQRGQLRRGRPLPPGIAHRPLPPELAATLPYFPGYRYYAVGPDLVLVASGSGLVAGLLPDALAR